MKNGSNVVPVIRQGNSVLRYHTTPLIVPETVGHHHANVAMLCEVLTGWCASRNLLIAALTHDIAEQWTGDVPYPFKAEHEEFRDFLVSEEEEFTRDTGVPIVPLTSDEMTILRVADTLDLVYTSYEEVMRGNQKLVPILETGLRVLDGLHLQGAPGTILSNLKEGFKNEINEWGSNIGQ